MTDGTAPPVVVRVPGDKSISHRALMLAALSDGVGTVDNLLRSADVESTAGVLRTLGVRIDIDGARATVHGRGLGALTEPLAPLDCGNSGTTTRLMAGIVAAHPFDSRFIGDESLSRRPMRRVAEPLEAMGARFTFEHGDGLPMTVHGGSLHSAGLTTRTASAQIKSAILLAALTARVPVTVTEPRQSRDHTERMLRARGVDVLVDGTTISLGVAQRLTPVPTTVPGDPSSAAFFVALAAMLAARTVRMPDVCLNPTRAGFIAVAQRMGVPIATGEGACTMGGEPVGTIVASHAPHLRAVTVGADEIPSMIDEVPILAALAARADGETVVRGAGELRVKESDRIAAVVSNLRAIGAQAEELEDGLVVRGSTSPLHGRVITHGDHRLAMAFGVLGALPGNDIAVDDAGCVGVSYPAFWDDLRRVTS